MSWLCREIMEPDGQFCIFPLTSDFVNTDHIILLVSLAIIKLQTCNSYCFILYLVFPSRWAGNSCGMDSLYDLDLISNTVPVILDNSKQWHRVLTTSMKLGSRGIAHVQGVSRADLKENVPYSNLLLINRTASPLSW